MAISSRYSRARRRSGVRPLHSPLHLVQYTYVGTIFTPALLSWSLSRPKSSIRDAPRRRGFVRLGHVGPQLTDWQTSCRGTVCARVAHGSFTVSVPFSPPVGWSGTSEWVLIHHFSAATSSTPSSAVGGLRRSSRPSDECAPRRLPFLPGCITRQQQLKMCPIGSMPHQRRVPATPISVASGRTLGGDRSPGNLKRRVNLPHLLLHRPPQHLWFDTHTPRGPCGSPPASHSPGTKGT